MLFRSPVFFLRRRQGPAPPSCAIRRTAGSAPPPSPRTCSTSAAAAVAKYLLRRRHPDLRSRDPLPPRLPAGVVGTSRHVLLELACVLFELPRILFELTRILLEPRACAAAFPPGRNSSRALPEPASTIRWTRSSHASSLISRACSSISCASACCSFSPARVPVRLLLPCRRWSSSAHTVVRLLLLVCPYCCSFAAAHLPILLLLLCTAACAATRAPIIRGKKVQYCTELLLCSLCSRLLLLFRKPADFQIII